MGFIEDWHPIYYKPNQVQLPYFIQDTPAARQDVAAQYTTISRLDQGTSIVPSLFIQNAFSLHWLNGTVLITNRGWK